MSLELSYTCMCLCSAIVCNLHLIKEVAFFSFQCSGHLCSVSMRFASVAVQYRQIDSSFLNRWVLVHGRSELVCLAYMFDCLFVCLVVRVRACVRVCVRVSSAIA